MAKNDHDHSNHVMPEEMIEPEPMAIPLDAVDPSGDWQGQQIELETGEYIGKWTFLSKEKGKYKGCKIRTYSFNLKREGSPSSENLNGEFTVHSRKSGKSIRTRVDFLLDMNDDGNYDETETMISDTKEGFRVKDALTNYTSFDYKDSLSLRKITNNGSFSFEIEEYSYSAPILTFNTQRSGQDNSFDISFRSDFNYEDLVVC